ncbi:Histone-lysine N-methyltransferase SETMAR [Habropoda laboriosa]|uniref:Histone-lysine N-methyltransferase SETMAR n=1 Tax=Habropoda laboriosa TaxID=597456 RepID=A0A0L7QQ02_9HYME|nr:Histone-lysine N-methyltransferase SETMAR [Habropoda laboriosa]
MKCPILLFQFSKSFSRINIIFVDVLYIILKFRVSSFYHDFNFCNHQDHFLCEKKSKIENTFKEFTDTRAPTFYKNKIKELVSRWQKCVDYNSSYFHKSKFNIKNVMLI